MQRKKKRSIIFELHSIPIKIRSLWIKANTNNSIPHNKSISLSNSKRLYLVSYSIPLSCMVVLLLGGIMFINPESSMETHALEVPDNSVSDLADDSFAGFGDTDFTVSDEDAEAGIMPLANVNPSLGLSVTNSDKVIETVQGGPTAYSDHLVTITGAEVTNYTLSMSTSSTNLTKPSGSSSTAANITGANGATGDSMPANRWGYSVVEESTSNSSYGGLQYATMPTISTTIASGNASSDNTLNVKKKLVIAAKFGEDATPGNYRQAITLSAVANANTVTFKITYNANGGSGTTPTAQSANSTENSHSFTLASGSGLTKSGYKFNGWSTNSSATSGFAAGSSYAVNRTNPQITLYAAWQSTGATWSNGTAAGTSTMQGITSSFCSSSIPAGSTVTLKDDRGSSPISYKIIKMNDGTCWMAENLRLVNTTITGSNSNTSGNFTIPASSISGWTSSDQSSTKAFYNNDTTYGAYYNYYTATAGSAPSGSGDASYSICPKGWKLPAYSGTGSFLSLNNSYSGSWTTVSGKNGRNIGYNSDNAFWPAAGYVVDGSLRDASSYGYYWSRAAYNADYAYNLYFYSNNVTMGFNARYYGYSVRCVAAP